MFDDLQLDHFAVLGPGRFAKALLKNKAEGHRLSHNHCVHSTSPKLFSMSQTTTLSSAGDAPKTVTLQNGNIFSFQSNQSIDLDLIPVIDASRIWSTAFEDRQAVAEEIRDASRKIGFFYLINHVGSSSNDGVNGSADDFVRRVSRRVMSNKQWNKPRGSLPCPRRRRWRYSQDWYRTSMSATIP